MEASLHLHKLMLCIWIRIRNICLKISRQVLSFFGLIKCSNRPKTFAITNRFGVYFHEENGRTHFTLQTLLKLKHIGCNVLLYLLYSPEYVTLDQNLSQSLHNSLNGQNLNSLIACNKHLVSLITQTFSTYFEDANIKQVD